MKFAYADPPYLGCAKLYKEHPEAHIWDDPETHRDLMARMDRIGLFTVIQGSEMYQRDRAADHEFVESPARQN